MNLYSTFQCSTADVTTPSQHPSLISKIECDMSVFVFIPSITAPFLLYQLHHCLYLICFILMNFPWSSFTVLFCNPKLNRNASIEEHKANLSLSAVLDLVVHTFSESGSCVWSLLCSVINMQTLIVLLRIQTVTHLLCGWSPWFWWIMQVNWSMRQLVSLLWEGIWKSDEVWYMTLWWQAS